MGSADERLYSGRSTKAEPKPPSFRGAIVVDQTRGSLRIRAWPRKRGKPRHPEVIRTTGWFSWQIRAWNVLPARVRMDAAAMANRTPWLPRDLWLAAQAGRLWAIDLEDGTTIWPMAAIHTLSESLDILTQAPGSLIVRGPTLWQPIPAGPAGYVLTSAGPGQVPIWAPTGASPDDAPVRRIGATELGAVGTAAPLIAWASGLIGRQLRYTTTDAVHAIIRTPAAATRLQIRALIVGDANLAGDIVLRARIARVLEGASPSAATLPSVTLTIPSGRTANSYTVASGATIDPDAAAHIVTLERPSSEPADTLNAHVHLLALELEASA